MSDTSKISTTSKGNRTILDNINNCTELCSWIRWYPDLFLDLIKPASGGINLHLDQRVNLRCLVRYVSVYNSFPRGYAKTYLEILAQVISCMSHPGIQLSVTAQTKDSAALLIKDKMSDILRHYPMLKNEIAKETYTGNITEVLFKNGARISNLANSQTSKGQRRHRLSVEESVLVDNETFEDSVKPIVEIPRYTVGKLSIVNPTELNQQINFFTTPGWRGSDEFFRSMAMINNMRELQGDIVLGSDWMLACWYGRGSSKSNILRKMKEMNPIAFAQNYGGTWTGSSSNALVDINKLLKCRSLETPITETNIEQGEYYIAVDVARSERETNNQGSIVVGKVERNPATSRVLSVDIINIISLPNTMNFEGQAAVIKKTANIYHPKMTVVDGNGLGVGLIDELLKESIDPYTKEPLGCWATINTDKKPAVDNAEKCLFDLKSQGIQTNIVVSFIDMIEGGRVRLLVRKQEQDFGDVEKEDYKNNILPFVQTDLLIDEIGNLKIKVETSKALKVEKVIRKINKDRFSALSYLLYYINEYTNNTKRRESKQLDFSKLPFRAPKSRTGRW